MRPSLKTLLAGFLASLAFHFVIYGLAPHLVGHSIDLGSMVAAILGVGSFTGLVAYFLLGTLVFPWIYAAFLTLVLPGPPWVKGLIWGTALWLGAEFVLRPLAGTGILERKADLTGSALVNLGAHAVYGLILGRVAAIRTSSRERELTEMRDDMGSTPNSEIL